MHVKLSLEHVHCVQTLTVFTGHMLQVVGMMSAVVHHALVALDRLLGEPHLVLGYGSEDLGVELANSEHGDHSSLDHVLGEGRCCIIVVQC